MKTVSEGDLALRHVTLWTQPRQTLTSETSDPE